MSLTNNSNNLLNLYIDNLYEYKNEEIIEIYLRIYYMKHTYNKEQEIINEDDKNLYFCNFYNINDLITMLNDMIPKLIQKNYFKISCFSRIKYKDKSKDYMMIANVSLFFN